MSEQFASPDSFTTLDGETTAEIKVQRSRFIAVSGPAAGADEVREFLARLGRTYHDSRHICHACRLGTPPDVSEARNDDGEPSGTGGEPILAELRKRELHTSVVAVVRYFGGIKLGTGGLARAYGLAAATALDAAVTREVRLGRTFRLAFPYAAQKTVGHLLTRSAGQVTSETYGSDVAWEVWLPHSRWSEFAAALAEAMAGAITLTPDDS